MGILILLGVVGGVILLGRYAIAEGQKIERQKKFNKNLNKHK